MAASADERLALKEIKFDSLPRFEFRFTKGLRVLQLTLKRVKPMREEGGL